MSRNNKLLNAFIDNNSTLVHSLIQNGESIISLIHDNTLLYYICYQYNKFKSEKIALLRSKEIEENYINNIKILLENGAKMHINEIVSQRKLNNLIGPVITIYANTNLILDDIMAFNTIISTAIMSFNDNLVELLLLNYNVDLSTISDDVLFRITDRKKFKIMKLLLSKGVQIRNDITINGDSLLQTCLNRVRNTEDLEGLYLLLSNGARDDNFYIEDREISLFIQIYDLLIKFNIITIAQIINLNNPEMDQMSSPHWKKDILLLYIFYNYDNDQEIDQRIINLPYYHEINPEKIRILFNIKSMLSFRNNRKNDRKEYINFNVRSKRENNRTKIQKFLNASNGPRKDWLMSISSYLGQKKYYLKFPFFILYNFDSERFLRYLF